MVTWEVDLDVLVVAGDFLNTSYWEVLMIL